MQQLKLDQVRLIPLNIPPHRSRPVASAAHRYAMLELAIHDEAQLSIDLRELDSNEVSYTINTLKSLRQEFKNDSLCLILGDDAFNKIDSWKEWERLLDYAHIIVANRPGESVGIASSRLKDWIERHQTKEIETLRKNLSGNIYFIEIPMLDISSSMIRQLLSNNESVEKLLPPATLTYIKNNHLYMDTA